MRTDLLIFPDTKLKHIDTGAQKMQANAGGVVILDDGVTLNSPIGRFDIFYLTQEDKDKKMVGGQINII